MASKKRDRAALAAGDIPASEPASPHFYHALPLEVRQRIVSMACLSPSSSTATRSPFHTDVATILSLCLVCKETHAQVADLLWQQVGITRPSALFAFYQALLLRPSRASLVTHLHIGPQDVLPSYWWPLSRVTCVNVDTNLAEADNTYHSIASSLNREQLPSGCVDRQAWLWDRRPSQRREAAVYEALEAVQQSLNVDFATEAAKPTKIESIFEAQAALDLYLDKIRSIEDKDPHCEDYPALHLIDVPASIRTGGPSKQGATPPPENAIIVTHSQLLRHLARPGSLTDRFDHPLILKRTGLKINVSQAELKGPTKFQPSKASYSLQAMTWSNEREHEAHEWQRGLDALQDAPQQYTGSGDVGDLDAALLATANMGAILRLARSALDLLPNLASLSLTGFLQEALVDAEPPKSLRDLSRIRLPSLRRVSIGPPLPCWAASLPLTKLSHLEELRICGSPLPFNEAWAITMRMTNLKVLTWSLAEPYPTLRDKGIVAVTYVLVSGHYTLEEEDENFEEDENLDIPSDLSDFSSDDDRPPFDGVIRPRPKLSGGSGKTGTSLARLSASASSNSAASSSNDPPTRHIILHLHPTDVAQILDAAATPETRQSWLEGRGRSAVGRRFWLRYSEAGKAAAAEAESESENGLGVERPSEDSHSVIWEKLFEEGRGWWGGEVDEGRG